jgi:hypothetical protein
VGVGWTGVGLTVVGQNRSTSLEALWMVSRTRQNVSVHLDDTRSDGGSDSGVQRVAGDRWRVTVSWFEWYTWQHRSGHSRASDPASDGLTPPLARSDGPVFSLVKV